MTTKKTRSKKKVQPLRVSAKELRAMFDDMLSGRTMHYVDVCARIAVKEASLDIAPEHIRIMVIARIACLCGVGIELVLGGEAKG